MSTSRVFADAQGETWTFAGSVGARVLAWESGSNVWRATEVEPSSDALMHVACALLKESNPDGFVHSPMVADAIRALTSDSSLDNLLALAHALRGLEWRPAD